MPRLKKLLAFNRERTEIHRHCPDATPNGIACPACGAELVDTEPAVTLTSDPPQKRVACKTCDFRGLRVA